MNETNSQAGAARSAQSELADRQLRMEEKQRAQVEEATFLRLNNMGSVGQLIAEIAHEFNCMLLVISAAADQLLLRLPADDPNRNAVLDISEAGTRAANLTERLRALSRVQALELISVYPEDVESPVGGGTASEIGCRAHAAQELSPTPSPEQARVISARETILLVEDDAAALESVQYILESHGYMVLAEPHGKAAIATAHRSSFPIDLLLTDVIMPEMAGTELADELLADSPHLPVLFMISPGDDDRVLNRASSEAVSLIRKPFLATDLLAKVRELLEKRAIAKTD